MKNTTRKLLTLRDERGFTLIELIVVVAVTGILGAVAVPTYSHIQAKAVVGSLHSNNDVKYSSMLTKAGGEVTQAFVWSDESIEQIVGEKPGEIWSTTQAFSLSNVQDYDPEATEGVICAWSYLEHNGQDVGRVDGPPVCDLLLEGWEEGYEDID